MQRTIDAEEFAWWNAYYQLEPFGPEREDLRMGIVASSIWNVQLPKRHRVKPADFIPVFDKAKRPQPQSPANMIAQFKMAVAMADVCAQKNAEVAANGR